MNSDAKGLPMASASGSRSSVFWGSLPALVLLLYCGALRAEEKPPLSGYVIEQFGQPPTVPEGPLSKKLQTAIQTAFIDSVVQSTWGKD